MRYLLPIAIILLMHVTLAVAGKNKFLQYKFNDSVVIIISNVPCPLEIKDKYPYASAAMRIDGQKLAGCFNHEGDNIIIQWYKGDTTTIPANVFLQTSDM